MARAMRGNRRQDTRPELDRETTAMLQAEGWTVLRIWERADERALAAKAVSRAGRGAG
ncbi:hypothetical protein ABXS69_00170 [Actinomyces timonensis]|uniref:DUF559 domain-containing protein n=1 Tax=Actinomyces timonensis TaxID=1288391 RepID=A0AAU8N5V9_9ACTO